MTIRKKALENIVGKGENAGNQHFLLFPRFPVYQGEISSLYPPQRSGEGYTGIAMAVHPSVCPRTQFCPELFSYSFAHTALKFIHNVCVHVNLCMCNFHDHTIIDCGIIFP